MLGVERELTELGLEALGSVLRLWVLGLEAVLRLLELEFELAVERSDWVERVLRLEAVRAVEALDWERDELELEFVLTLDGLPRLTLEPEAAETTETADWVLELEVLLVGLVQVEPDWLDPDWLEFDRLEAVSRLRVRLEELLEPEVAVDRLELVETSETWLTELPETWLSLERVERLERLEGLDRLELSVLNELWLDVLTSDFVEKVLSDGMWAAPGY